MGALRIKRVYDVAEAGDGTRILVDRLWPRGLAKEKAAIDLWLKEIAPSDGLRKQVHGGVLDWDEFRAAYAAELAAVPAAVAALRDYLAEGPVTLLYAAKDQQHNNAVALRLWLEELA